MASFRVLMVGGGSGGHVYPLFAVADELQNQARQQGIELELLFLGEGTFFERAAKERGFPFRKIVSGKLRRYASAANILDIFKIPVGFFQSLWYLFQFMPDAVFAKGGSASVMPAIVARLYFIPLFIHESDSVPGLANKIIGALSRKVFVSFRSAAKYFGSKAIVSGNPTRTELLSGDKAAALQTFNLKNDKKTILVIGGSQGAKVINDAVLDALVLLAKKFQIIHQCGDANYQAVKKEVEKFIKEGAGEYDTALQNNYRLYSFFDSSQLALAYAAADIIVTRAGANSLFEIAALGKPAIIIPIASSNGDHQLMNAREFSKFGGDVIEEENLTRNLLLDQIESLFRPEKYEDVSEKIKTLATPNASTVIAQEILAVIR